MRARFLKIVVIGAGLTAAGCRGQDRAMRFNPLLTALDTDHDGVISADEIRNAAASLKALDKNGDGQISEDEVRPVRPQGREEGRREGPPGGGQSPDEMVKSLMAFDKNGDGKLSKDELPERMQGMFERGDANHDGFLSADEIRSLAAAQAGPRGEGRRPFPNPIFAVLDANHDGVISAEEIRNAPAALKTLDKNGDGQLTMDELMPPRREREGREGPGRERERE